MNEGPATAAEAELKPILEEQQPSSSSQRPAESLLRRLYSRFPSLRNPLYQTAAKNLGLILTWYFFSTLLSLWNSQLLGKNRGVLGKGAFPAPLLMSSWQFACQILLAKAVLHFRLVKRKNPEPLSWHAYSRQVVPNGVSTGLDIGLSNYSLSLITLSFYTMCKSTTPVFLLCFCFLWGIERPSWSLAGVVGIISVGLTLLVFGETQFDLAGFIVVMFASMLSGLRWTITQLLLQGNEGHGASGGPVEVLAALTPVMSITVLIMSLVVERLWVVLPRSPYFDTAGDLAVTSGLMLFGGVIAFTMVWVEFTVIAETSALTFMVAGTFKEFVTVMAAVAFLGEDFFFINGVGLVVLIAGVAVFNWTKYRKAAGAMEGAARTPRASIGGLADLPPHHHRRTSSDALEALEHGGHEHENGNGSSSPMGSGPVRPPVSPGSIALTAVSGRDSVLKQSASGISGPASHRRDVLVPGA
ncbi:hypothetical protein WJX73_003560 [Symbiochloris irregularis]|uniref:Sugar phosphate transporter domain-containing protein n=1 Tax=Symbiochloris irregularis TaxID=706552 RepID=A0AAW1Q0A9_9CHLO